MLTRSRICPLHVFNWTLTRVYYKFNTSLVRASLDHHLLNTCLSRAQLNRAELVTCSGRVDVGTSYIVFNIAKVGGQLKRISCRK